MKNHFYKIYVADHKTGKEIKEDIVYTLDRAKSDIAFQIGKERIEKNTNPIYVSIVAIKFDTLTGSHYPIMSKGTHKYFSFYLSENQSKDFDIQLEDINANLL